MPAYPEGSARMLSSSCSGEDAINSFLDSYESPSIPTRQVVNCCCGATTCAYLQHTETALSGLERDLRNAAQIGKVRTLVHLTVFHHSCALWSLSCNVGERQRARVDHHDGGVADFCTAGAVDAT